MNMKDDWVAAALSNDILVAELLSRLTQSSSHPPPHPFLRLPRVWGHRQRRSKPRKGSAAMTDTRRSPTTPLSWSRSDGDDSNSSRPPSDLSRSNKGAYGDDVTNNILSSSNKKRVTLISTSFFNLTGLQSLAEEESVLSLLLKETEDLGSMDQQRARRQSLNRTKFDHVCATSSCPNMEEAPSCPTHHHKHKASFALPDLNMMPSEEEEAMT